MKNTKANFLNLFVHEITSDFRALSDRERINVIGHDWYQICMEKIEKYIHEKSNIFPSMQRFFGSKSLP